MKIVHETRDRLIFESRPVVLALISVVATLGLTALALAKLQEGAPGVAALVLGCLVLFVVPMILVTFERVQVILDAGTGLCTLHRRNLRGETTETRPLDEVARAMVQTRKGDDDSADAHRVALVIGDDSPDARHPLTRFHISGGSAQKASDRINAWLRTARSDG